MTHKVNPKIFRTSENKDWDSRWIGGKKYSKYLEEDFKIRKFLEEKLKDAAIEKIEIERFSDKIDIIISTSRPGLVIGRGGEGVDELRKTLIDKVLKSKEKQRLKLEIKGVRDHWTSANLSGQWIARQIEGRVPFRRVMKSALSKIMSNKNTKGVRIQVSGRLNGAEIARTEWMKEGNLPRQTLRANIDYAENRARCTYGAIGVKVWLYKGEEFNE
jgi:small subunit ribosomal protein S3